MRRSSPNSSLRALELVLDDPHETLLGGEDALEIRDEGQRLLVLLDDLVALELGQALQPHVEDVPGLDLGELEADGSTLPWPRLDSPPGGSAG